MKYNRTIKIHFDTYCYMWSLNSITIPDHVYPQSSKREKKRKTVRCDTYNDSGSPHSYEAVN